MARKRGNDNAAQFDELRSRRGETGPGSAGQSGDLQGLSNEEDIASESVEELAEEDQPLEAAALEGLRDAEDHPERPVHTHESGRPEPEDIPRRKRSA